MVKITRLLLFVILIAGLFFQADFVRAESDNCYWQLISEIPRAFTASPPPNQLIWPVISPERSKIVGSIIAI